MDEELNRAIDAALDEVRSVKPTPDFLPRLRAHVEGAPRPARIDWWLPLAASAATIMAGVMIAAVLSRQPAIGTPQPAVSSRQPAAGSSPSAVPSLPPALAVSEPSAHAGANTRVRSRPPLRSAPREPEVLVPASARGAIVRLVEALNAGDERARGAVLRLGLPGEIVVEPIRIDPVVVPPMKESS
jgi:hypothetical protein